MYTYEDVINKCPDDILEAMMKGCVNKNLYDTNNNYLNDLNQIGVNDEVVEETKGSEN